MWELDYKESWVLKNWCFWTVVLEKTLERPSDCKEIQPVHPKGDQSWVLIGRTDVEAKTPILRPPDGKSWLIWKNPKLRRIEGKRRRGRQRIRCLDGITDSMDRSLGKLGSWWWTRRPGVLQSMESQRVEHNWATELNWICIQVSCEAGKRFSYFHLFECFLLFVMIHTVKGFSLVNETEVDIFLEFPYFVYEPANIGNLISCSSAFSKTSLNIWKFLVHVLLKPSLKDFWA